VDSASRAFPDCHHAHPLKTTVKRIALVRHPELLRDGKIRKTSQKTSSGFIKPGEPRRERPLLILRPNGAKTRQSLSWRRAWQEVFPFFASHRSAAKSFRKMPIEAETASSKPQTRG